jgi:hypothetical protein
MQFAFIETLMGEGLFRSADGYDSCMFTHCRQNRSFDSISMAMLVQCFSIDCSVALNFLASQRAADVAATSTLSSSSTTAMTTTTTPSTPTPQSPSSSLTATTTSQHAQQRHESRVLALRQLLDVRLTIRFDSRQVVVLLIVSVCGFLFSFTMIDLGRRRALAAVENERRHRGKRVVIIVVVFFVYTD